MILSVDQCLAALFRSDLQYVILIPLHSVLTENADRCILGKDRDIILPAEVSQQKPGGALSDKLHYLIGAGVIGQMSLFRQDPFLEHIRIKAILQRSYDKLKEINIH